MSETQKGAFYGTIEVGYSGSKNRKVVNVVLVMINLFLPWTVFCLVCFGLVFELHYHAPSVAILIPIACIIASVYCIRSTTFMLKLFGMLTLASAVSAMVVGDLIFWHDSQQYYAIRHMATYVNVNPTAVERDGKTLPVSGARYMDAGKIYFTADTKVDVSKAVAFKLHDLYCAAPISTAASGGGHDFWAVGMNCCSDIAVDFRCGDVGTAVAGLREVSDARRPLYRMAVLEAEGIHGITSRHPIFFEWTNDPEQTIENRFLHAHALYLLSIFAHLLVNGALLTFAIKCAKRSHAH
eukprot:GEMP01047981.1.p1 GENE.GEMP01047981.1~~GEMP01047981.1.p1  ORF type:complete len:296 (+),score=63.87 GEMP01047981.1:165-1052(+)